MLGRGSEPGLAVVTNVTEKTPKFGPLRLKTPARKEPVSGVTSSGGEHTTH